MTKPSWSSLLGDDRFVPLVVTADGRVLEPNIRTVVADERDKWIIIAPPHVRLHPELKEIVLRESLSRPDIDLFYGDEVAPVNEGDRHDIILKPALDLTLLIADDYIGFPLVVRASAIHRLGGLRPATN